MHWLRLLTTYRGDMGSINMGSIDPSLVTASYSSARNETIIAGVSRLNRGHGSLALMLLLQLTHDSHNIKQSTMRLWRNGRSGKKDIRLANIAESY
eukprot:scaffold56447_cov19-Prasinocladus_malaysianus.AAC.1